MSNKSSDGPVTERQRIEQEREVTVRLLSLLNAASNLFELLRDVTLLVREALDYDAVGIRLRAGDDFPYFETRGFSPEFVLAENQLCERDPEGQTLRDVDGHPVLECMCGNVLRGRFNPARPFFTARGSFWTNSTTELLASTTDADRLARTRHRCQGEGYESVALFALRVGQIIYGLLQVNDKRRDRFTPERIAFLERLADSLAVAIAHRQSEQQLRESEERYRLLADNAEDFVLLNHVDGRRLYVSPSFYRVTGWTPQEFQSADWRTRIHPDDLPLVEKTRAANLAGETTQIEYRMRCKDGSWLWVDTRCKPIAGPDGRVQQMQLWCRDVTRRKQAEAGLKQVSEQRQLALNAAHMGWWHYDPVTKIATWDERYKEIFGVTGSQRPNEEILRLLHPDDLPRVWAAVEAALDPADPKPYTAEYRVNRPDGSMRWVEAHGLAAFEGEGERRHATSFVGTVTDITERKRVEEELKRHRDRLEDLVQERTAALEVSETRYRQLFQQAPDAIILVDAETGELVEFNTRAHESLGYSRDEFQQLRIPDFEVIESPEGVAAHLGKIVREGSDTFETRQRTKTGEIRDVRVTVGVLSVGGKTYLQGIGTDITERKRAEAALQAAAQQWQSTFDAVADAVWLLDPDYRIRRSNKAGAALFGKSLDEVLGRRCCEVVHGTRQPIPECPTLRMTASRCREFLELAMHDRWYQVTVDPLIAEDGVLRGAVHIVRDITDRKRAEEEIKAAKELLEQRVTERTEAIQMLHDIASLANEAQNAEQAIQSCLERVTRYGGWNYGQALRPASDNPDELLPTHACHTADAQRFRRFCEVTRGIRFRRGQDLPGRVFASGTPEWTTDLRRHMPGRGAVLADELGMCTGVAFPVLVGEKVAAVLEFFSERVIPPDARITDAMAGVGMQLGRVLERVEFHEHLLTIAEDTQRSIAQDLHDDIGQELTGLGLMAEALAQMLSSAETPAGKLAADLAAGMDRTRNKLRGLSHGLLPVELEEGLLAAALGQLTVVTAPDSYVACHVDCPHPDTVFDSRLATHLYRIAQEAVSNAVRHSRARNIRITLDQENGEIALRIEDDGTGLPAEAARTGGMGLRTMRYRAGLIGAKLEVGPGPRGGTLVVCRVLPRPAERDADPRRGEFGV